MLLFLALLTGICWTIVYTELIYLGFKNKTYGMPSIALALNFTWEAFYSYVSLKNNWGIVQISIITIWFLLNIIIVYTYLKYGIKHFPQNISEKYFIPWNIIIFSMPFIIQYSFFIEFGKIGALYSAFLQDLIMSILFINMFVNRTDTKGQNLIIAISKWIGSLAATIFTIVVYANKLCFVLGIFCSLFNIIYIHLLIKGNKMYL